MKEQLIREVLDQQAEQETPMSRGRDLWPSIHGRIQSDDGNHGAMPQQARAVRMLNPHTTGSPSNTRSTPLTAGTAMVMVTLVALATLGIILVSVNRPQSTSFTQGGDALFVPEGSVRHVVISYTRSFEDLLAPGSIVTPPVGYRGEEHHTQDLSYTNGTHRLHLYIVDTFGWLTQVSTGTTWIDEQYIYEPHTSSTGIGPTQVFRYDYKPDYFDFYGPEPDLIAKKLKLPGARLIGNTTLYGRPVVQIETASTGYPPDALKEIDVPAEYYSQATPEPPSSNKERVVTRFQLWIDTQSHQILKWQHSRTYISGPRSGQVETQGSHLVLDEIRNLSEFPPGYFEFKMPLGAELVEPTPATTPEVTPASQSQP